MEKKYQKLIKNTVIFSIGEFANKILNFLIVPLYTYVLTTEQYGQIDLLTTSISFLIPIITLQIHEAMLRYLLGKEIDHDTAVSNCWAVYICGALFTTALYPGYFSIFGSHKLALIFTVSVLMSAFNGIFVHYLRAVGKTVEYTAKGVLGTTVNLACNVLFVLILKLGMDGYLFAMLISQAVGVCYMLSVGGLKKHLNFRAVNKAALWEMLRYSIPLIPNTMMWWIMSAGDKYIINWVLGDSANGLYSLALKMPTIISLFYAFFYQAWQMSAIEENNSTQRDRMYNAVYRLTNALLILMVSGVVLIIKPLYVLIISERFAPSWMYVPILTLATAFSCQASFFGVVYTTTKATQKVFSTTALGAIINLAFNALLIRPLELHGVAIGTFMGYVTVACVRAYDTRKVIKIDFDFHRLLLGCIVLLIQIVATLRMHTMINGIGVLCFVLLTVIYRKEVMQILKTIIRKFLRK